MINFFVDEKALRTLLKQIINTSKLGKGSSKSGTNCYIFVTWISNNLKLKLNHKRSHMIPWLYCGI
jgi:arginyl-tRNA synthetase